MDEATAIKCFATGGIFKIRRDSSCQMENVIYVAFCLNCQKQGDWRLLDKVSFYTNKILISFDSCSFIVGVPTSWILFAYNYQPLE